MAGLGALLTYVRWLDAPLKIAGALYLVWYGIRLLMSAARSSHTTRSRTQPIASLGYGNGLRTGLFVSLTNPKSGMFWTSIFTTTLPVDPPLWVYVATAAMIALLSGGWHSGIAMVFAIGRVRSVYRRLRRPIDAVCGALLMVLGMRISLGRRL